MTAVMDRPYSDAETNDTAREATAPEHLRPSRLMRTVVHDLPWGVVVLDLVSTVAAAVTVAGQERAAWAWRKSG
jgi:hypothetical protein